MTIRVSAMNVCSRIAVAEFSETVFSKTLARVPGLSETGTWVAGGSVRRTLEGKTLDSDFDFFFRSVTQMEAFEAALRDIGGMLHRENNKNKTYVVPSTIRENADSYRTKLPEMKVQLIFFRYFETAQAVIESFDFTLCQFAFDGESIYMTEFALWDVARKKLVPAQITFATLSLRRLIKYAGQGFTVCGGALSDILQQVVANPQIIESDTLYID